MKYFSLFAGIGGFDLPLKEMNFSCVGWSEIDKYAIRTFEANFPELKGLNYGEITEIKTEELPDFDLLVGGSPCQSFSIAGKREGLKGISGLFYHYLRILQDKKPSWFIWENVKGVLSSNGGKDFENITRAFSDCGYTIKGKILNTKDYGIPQSRQRCFIVGQREDLGIFNFEFPPKQKLTICLQDILEIGYVDTEVSRQIRAGYSYTSESDLSDYLKESRGQIVYTDREISHCIDANYHKGGNAELYKKGLRQIVFAKPVRVGEIGNGGQAERIYSKLGTSTALRAEAGGGGGKTGLYEVEPGTFRKLTTLECFRLQGFPDGFWKKAKETGNSNQQLYRQAGNAVTTTVIKAILQSLFLDNNTTKQLSLF
jgi:DNA-cytosine methyltransferase